MKVVVVCWVCGIKISVKDINRYDAKESISHSICDECVDIVTGIAKRKKYEK